MLKFVYKTTITFSKLFVSIMMKVDYSLTLNKLPKYYGYSYNFLFLKITLFI